MSPSTASTPLSPLDPCPLLLSPELARSEVARLWTSYGVVDWKKADANLQLMAGDPGARKLLAKILLDLLVAVSNTADPDQAINSWERFLDAGNARNQVFSFLAQARHILRLVCVLFGNSPAMAETLIRDPTLIYWLEEERILKARPTKTRLEVLLDSTLGAVKTYDRQLDALRRFHRREMLRIGARDLFRVASVQETYRSLSQLADLVVQAAYDLVAHRLNTQYGISCQKDVKGKCKHLGFVVLGMGKLGGKELNYSSDIDLVYIHESPKNSLLRKIDDSGISTESYFESMARTLTQVLSVSTSEGAMFRVDLRLRPEGTSGPLVCSLDEAVQYYQTRGRDWERLAFLKARPIAGDLRIGKSFLKKIRPFVMGQDEVTAKNIVQTVHSLRTQIHQKVIRKGEQDRNVKLGPGGIRDVEFIVQTLQLLHVALVPSLFEMNTLKGVSLLVNHQYLLPEQGEQLSRCYLYLRDVEHKLQMVHELQTHTIPLMDTEVFKCAHRMGYLRSNLKNPQEQFLSDYRSILSQVVVLFEKVIG